MGETARDELGFTIGAVEGKARTGSLQTSHGPVDTPAFMPVGTAGAIKGVTPDQLRDAGVQMVLANTYHLMLRPGAQTVAELGGLHSLMNWPGPILTDSGGYQVFSLAHLRRLDDDGVVFQSHIDGSLVPLTPASAIDIQRLLGADIIMQLDECPPAGASADQLTEAVRRSADWARISRDAWAHLPSEQGRSQALFGIQQGGTDLKLRAKSAASLVELDLPGYAVGGLSVGEPHQAMAKVLDDIDNQFPRNKPRYLMGVGEPRDILTGVACGVDMFDCVLPTRNGRNAQAFTWSGRVRLRNARWTRDTRPLDENCGCYCCRHYSRGVLRHLFLAGEMLGPTLVSIHNLHFFTQLLARIRQAIAEGRFADLSRDWLVNFTSPAEGTEMD